MLDSCCIYSGSFKSMNYCSQFFGLSLSLILSLCHILTLIAIKTRRVFVLGHLQRHSLLFRYRRKTIAPLKSSYSATLVTFRDPQLASTRPSPVMYKNCGNSCCSQEKKSQVSFNKLITYWQRV